MTNTFVTAVQDQSAKSVKKANKTTTTNGAKAFKSTLNANVDLFGKAGSARGQNLTGLFDLALQEEPEIALRNLLYIRDVRGGMGEREMFRTLLKRVADVKPAYLIETSFLEKTAEVGRWDDLLTLFTPQTDKRINEKVVTLLKQALADGIMAKEILSNIDNMSEDQCQIILNELYTCRNAISALRPN